MKKYISLILAILSFSLFSACTSYTSDRSYMTKEATAQEEKILQDAKEKYNKATTDGEKQKQLFEMAFRYQNLGDYDGAINYYEKVLELSPIHYQSLNNLAVIYEEMGKIPKALQYEQKLYENNVIDPEVINDVIRLLVKNQQLNSAQQLLETFAKSSAGKNNLEFISSQYAFIQEEKDKQLNPTQANQK